jgi:UDP-glucose:(heptosyl)LPS alpha-1,3-glucosyltransferase
MERQLTELVKGLLRLGYLVTVVARRCDLPLHPGLRWVRVPGPARPVSLAYPWFFLAGSLKVWRHRQGVLHTTGAIIYNRADVATVHLCHHGVHAKINSLASRRSSFWYQANAWVAGHLSRLGERWCYRPTRLRHLVGVSRGVAREVQEHFPNLAESASVIPNGVDATIFHPDAGARAKVRASLHLAEYDFVALFVAGDWEWKGLSLVIESVAKTPGCHLLVVGGGDVPRYRGLAAEHRAEDRVHFTGSTPDAAAYYAAADAFVLPSVYETFSLVTYEAAASGLPLLVTHVSGVEDLLVDGWNGWFIERNVDDIAARLSQLLRDKTLRRTMGARARAAGEGFGWDQMVEGYLRLYRRLDHESGAELARKTAGA